MSDATTLGHPVFDADNHYYEAEDAFTRHLDPALGPRVIQWCEINGRRYHVIGGRVSRAVTNPDLRSRSPCPGPCTTTSGATPTTATRWSSCPAGADPARLPGPGGPGGDPRRAGPGRLPALPDPRHDLRGAAGPRPRGRVPPVPGLQPLAGRGLGHQLRGPDLRRPLHHAGRSGLGRRGADLGARAGRPHRRDAPGRPDDASSVAAPRSTPCSTASGSWPTTPASRWWSTPPTAASPPTATPSTGSPPPSAAGGSRRSSRSPSSRPSVTTCCRRCSRTSSSGSPTCGWPRWRTGPQFLPDLLAKVRSTANKMPGYWKDDPVETVPAPRVDQPVLGGRRQRRRRLHGRRPGHLRVGLAPHRGVCPSPSTTSAS